MVRQAFDVIDVDRSGTLDSVELRALLAQLHPDKKLSTPELLEATAGDLEAIEAAVALSEGGLHHVGEEMGLETVHLDGPDLTDNFRGCRNFGKQQG